MSQHTPDAWIERNEDDPDDPYYTGGDPNEPDEDDDDGNREELEREAHAESQTIYGYMDYFG